MFVLLLGEEKGAMVVADRRGDVIKLSVETRHKRLTEAKQRTEISSLIIANRLLYHKLLSAEAMK